MAHQEEHTPSASNKPTAMKILVIGKSGAGKSTLINSLLRQRVARVQRGISSQDRTVLEMHEGNIDGVQLTFYEARVLGNPDVSNVYFASQLREKNCMNFDLVLICIKLTERLDYSTLEGIRDVSGVFGENFWERSIILTTFTNAYESQLEDENKVTKEVMSGEIMKEVNSVFSILKEQLCHVPKEVFEEIPICCVGRIRKGKENEDKRLCTSDNWVDDVFNCSMIRCSKQSEYSKREITTVHQPIFSVRRISRVIGGMMCRLHFPGFGTVRGLVAYVVFSALIGILVGWVEETLLGQFMAMNMDGWPWIWADMSHFNV